MSITVREVTSIDDYQSGAASDSWKIVSGNTWRAVANVTGWKKGSFLDSVTATSRDEYPDDGAEGDKYYEWKGIF